MSTRPFLGPSLRAVLDKFLARDAATAADGMPIVAIVDRHGKHRAPALVQLLSTVLGARGWAVRVTRAAVGHLAVLDCGCLTNRPFPGAFCTHTLARCRRQANDPLLAEGAPYKPEPFQRGEPPHAVARCFFLEQAQARQRALEAFEPPLLKELAARGLPC